MPPKPAERDETLSPEMKLLVEKYARLPMKIAHDFLAASRPNGTFLDPDEIFSAATWALVDAGLRYGPYCVENGYDPKNLAYFQAFLSRSIKGALYDYVRSVDYVTREIRELSRTIRSMLALGKSREDICQELSIEDFKYSTALAFVQNTPWSFDYFREPDQSDPPEIFWEPPKADAEFAGAILLRAFSDIINSFSRDQQLVIALRYYSGMELPKIALCLGISGVAVQKIHTTVILEIQERMEAVAWKNLTPVK